MNLLLETTEAELIEMESVETLSGCASLAPTDEELLVIRCPLAPQPKASKQRGTAGGACLAPASAEPDWFELALQTEAPVVRPVVSSWGDDDDEVDEEIPDEDAAEEDEESDPFEDFDEEDFDDDFDDDFEEELEDEYEIEPKDDGFAFEEVPEEVDPELLEEDGAETPNEDADE
ncbi:hypothetical protein VN12_17525 [Pirellula sp. SH-Sr6A]|uniref:hypothetical protein n=1 Tax=Pirellula sp. SH-Sr6A TaxID=1632865 RepID=UPI00078D0936|nr:hypothetical protein [Pirellula sp. SH-Sr6A]AMV33934.1 hypothetical protein VN12_17525 [Pirellula sp. SH-Sr6A]